MSWARPASWLPWCFPGFIAVILRDALAALWPSADAWLDTGLGDLFFLAVFLLLISLLFPPMVRRWWNCRAIPAGRTRHVAQTVLDHVGVRVAEIVDWPILEGRVLTAGVLGLAPRLRYLLITKALAESLSDEQMAAVGSPRGRPRQTLARVFVFAVFHGLFCHCLCHVRASEPGPGGAAISAFGHRVGHRRPHRPGGPGQRPWPVDLAAHGRFLVVYLRFGMGFFMRHFERQADLFSVRVVGGAQPLIGALERISYLSGNIRDVPSWHHFSVAQRVEAMRRAESGQRLYPPHSRMLRRGLAVYLAVVLVLVGLGLGIDYSPAGENMQRALLVRLLEDRAAAMPNNARLRMQLGVLRYEMGQERPGPGRPAFGRGHEIPATPSPQQPGLAAGDGRRQGPARSGQGLDLPWRPSRSAPRPTSGTPWPEAYFVNGQPGRAESAAWAALESGPGPSGGITLNSSTSVSRRRRRRAPSRNAFAGCDHRPGLRRAELLLKRFVRRLPNISALMGRGLHGPLRSVDPPITVPAWACMTSGMDPGQLGLYGFRNRKGYGYDALGTASSADVQFPRLWGHGPCRRYDLGWPWACP